MRSQELAKKASCQRIHHTSVPLIISWYHLMVETIQERSTCELFSLRMGTNTDAFNRKMHPNRVAYRKHVSEYRCIYQISLPYSWRPPFGRALLSSWTSRHHQSSEGRTSWLKVPNCICLNCRLYLSRSQIVFVMTSRQHQCSEGRTSWLTYSI